MERREFFKGIAGTATGVGGFVNSGAQSIAQVGGPESAQIGGIDQLQANYHRAKTTQDIDLMMSLWDADAILPIQGDPGSSIGFERVQSFYLNSILFTNHRFSLVPWFKTQIKVTGDDVWLYFECHHVGNFVVTSRRVRRQTRLRPRYLQLRSLQLRNHRVRSPGRQFDQMEHQIECL